MDPGHKKVAQVGIVPALKGDYLIGESTEWTVARLYNVPNWTKKKRAGRSAYMRYMSRIVTRSKNNVLEVYLTANLTAKIATSIKLLRVANLQRL